MLGTSDIIAIYAAIISTGVAFWEVIKYRIDKKPKLAIELGFQNQALVYYNKPIGEFEQYLVITITNTGNYKRLIKKPAIQTLEKISDSDFFSLLDMQDQNKYPFHLDSGEQFEYKIHSQNLNDSFKSKGVTKIRALVFDTHKKSFTSDWIKI